MFLMNAIPILSSRPDFLFLVNMQTKEVQITNSHKLINILHRALGSFFCLGIVPITVPILKIGTIGKWYISRRPYGISKSDLQMSRVSFEMCSMEWTNLIKGTGMILLYVVIGWLLGYRKHFNQ